MIYLVFNYYGDIHESDIRLDSAWTTREKAEARIIAIPGEIKSVKEMVKEVRASDRKFTKEEFRLVEKWAFTAGYSHSYIEEIELL